MKIYVLDESNYLLAHEQALELRDWLDGQVERLGSWPIDAVDNIFYLPWKKRLRTRRLMLMRRRKDEL